MQSNSLDGVLGSDSSLLAGSCGRRAHRTMLALLARLMCQNT